VLAPTDQVTIVEAPIAEVRACGELLREHYEEVCTNKPLMVLDPDWDRFEQLEADGLLVTLVARDGERVVGYSVTLLVLSHLHYRSLSYGANDLLFVTASSRRGGLGKALIRRTEEAVAGRGYRCMQWHAKENTALELVLRRMGYRSQDHLLMKEI
jgi:GNAT superfamily N-acetyltransferase